MKKSVNACIVDELWDHRDHFESIVFEEIIIITVGGSPNCEMF